MSRRSVSARTLALPFVALALAGCVTPPQGEAPVVAECQGALARGVSGPALVGQPYGVQMTPLPMNSVQFDSAETASRIAIQAIHAERTPSNTVGLVARVLNCSDSSVSLRFRVSFLKAGGAPAEPISAWKVVHITPRATALYEEKSVATGVANYLVEIAAH